MVFHHFTRRNVKTTYYGLSSTTHLAPQIWELVPQSLKKCNTLNEFKTKIKSWYPDSTIRFHLKRIHTSFYGITKLYTCHHSIL